MCLGARPDPAGDCSPLRLTGETTHETGCLVNAIFMGYGAPGVDEEMGLCRPRLIATQLGYLATGPGFQEGQDMTDRSQEKSYA